MESRARRTDSSHSSEEIVSVDIANLAEHHRTLFQRAVDWFNAQGLCAIELLRFLEVIVEISIKVDKITITGVQK